MIAAMKTIEDFEYGLMWMFSYEVKYCSFINAWMYGLANVISFESLEGLSGIDNITLKVLM